APGTGDEHRPDPGIAADLPDRVVQVGGELRVPGVQAVRAVKLDLRPRSAAVEVDGLILAVKLIVAHAGHASRRGETRGCQARPKSTGHETTGRVPRTRPRGCRRSCTRPSSTACRASWCGCRSGRAPRAPGS